MLACLRVRARQSARAKLMTDDTIYIGGGYHTID